jgi:hypothetical protein
MGYFVGQDAEEKEDSRKKSHGPMGGPSQPGVVVGEIIEGQTPGDQSKDDEPGVVKRNLYP